MHLPSSLCMDYVLRTSFSEFTGDCVYASSTCWEGDASRTLRSSALQVIYNITEEESPHPSAYKGHTTRLERAVLRDANKARSKATGNCCAKQSEEWYPSGERPGLEVGGLVICFTEMDSSILLPVLVRCVLFLGSQRRDLLLPACQTRDIISVPTMHAQAFWSLSLETAYPYLLEVYSLAPSNQRIIAESCIHRTGETNNTRKISLREQWLFEKKERRETELDGQLLRRFFLYPLLISPFDFLIQHGLAVHYAQISPVAKPWGKGIHACWLPPTKRTCRLLGWLTFKALMVGQREMSPVYIDHLGRRRWRPYADAPSSPMHREATLLRVLNRTEYEVHVALLKGEKYSTCWNAAALINPFYIGDGRSRIHNMFEFTFYQVHTVLLEIPNFPYATGVRALFPGGSTLTSSDVINRSKGPSSPFDLSVEANKRAVHNYYQSKRQTITYRSLSDGPQHRLVWRTMPQVDGNDLLDEEVTGKNKKEVEEEAARQLAVKLGLPTA
ncbi:hypothetical protein PLEOSDRAFT_164265 [Pleurotus ostreatus PC15]|uniref:DRBM domain-containing protein n=1 Tax=Pleurotus ostreatus (strain PC15) TaxID=1137138 RepID=A0A067P0I8_PLEO1|nr:hypothetical protein PLEOSDRAFT_164265 [Pleurotus ostreatus PC15]